MRRLVRSLLGAAVLALCTGNAGAGVLLEAELAGVPVRVEVGSDQGRASAAVAGTRYLVDLGPGAVYALNGATPDRPRASVLSAPVPTPPSFSLERWSEGPVVGDHGSAYNVLIVGERICGEVLASPWMTSFTEPLVRTLELLQRVEPALAPRPHEACPPVGFGVYAGDGFPLLAGYKGEPVFRVSRLHFDHRPAASGFALPTDPAGCDPPDRC